jgi:hypothetical protein
MTMGKSVYRFRPGGNWNIGEHESWLSDMALQGLHLESIGNNLGKFTKGEPRRVRYRIEISQGMDISQEQKDMYLESGWTYVTSCGDLNIFSSLSEEDAPELHTDPAEQSYALSYLEKKLTREVILFPLMIALTIGILYFFVVRSETPYLSTVEGNTIQSIIYLVLTPFFGYQALQAAITIRTLRKALADGRAINHSAPWKAKQRKKKAEISIFYCVWFLAMILPLLVLTKSKTETLPPADNGLPIVRLTEIEKNPALEPRSLYRQDNVDWGNNYRYNWSLVSPIQYVAEENGIIADERWKDGRGVYSPSIISWVYKLNFPSIKEKLLEDLIKSYGKYNGGELQEREHSGFDKLITREGDNIREVFAAKGKGVIYIRYYGYANIDSIIEATAEKIALISD